MTLRLVHILLKQFPHQLNFCKVRGSEGDECSYVFELAG